MNRELSRSIRTRRISGFCLLILVGVMLSGCSRPDEFVANNAPSEHNTRIQKLSRLKEAVVPFFKPMQIQDYDWLEQHSESGETFEQYVESNPTLPTVGRNIIYIQPIGNFTVAERKVLELTADYMRAFYNLPVKLSPGKRLGNVPKDQSRRIYQDKLQVRTGYFLNDVLPKMLPKDAAALVCFTNYDLYPEPAWSFVFGQASLDGRVGVWSLSRLGDSNGKVAERKLFLSRTLKIAVHETGHMFSMRHCTKYECLMSGTNSLTETDRRPLDNCPECMAKIAWAMHYDPETRFKNLSDFWRRHGWADEEKLMLEKGAAVSLTRYEPEPKF